MYQGKVNPKEETSDDANIDTVVAAAVGRGNLWSCAVGRSTTQSSCRRHCARDGNGVGASLPKQLHDKAALEATYRFLQWGHVSYEDLIRPYVEMTRQDACEQREVELIQATTEVDDINSFDA